MFEYDELASNAVKVLDKYDLREIILNCRTYGVRDAYDIMEAVADYYSNTCFGCEEVAKALDELSLDEFMEYTSTRYKDIRWREEIHYKIC